MIEKFIDYIFAGLMVCLGGILCILGSPFALIGWIAEKVHRRFGE